MNVQLVLTTAHMDRPALTSREASDVSPLNVLPTTRKCQTRESRFFLCRAFTKCYTKQNQQSLCLQKSVWYIIGSIVDIWKLMIFFFSALTCTCMIFKNMSPLICFLAIRVCFVVLYICALAVQCALQKGLVSCGSRRGWLVSEHDSHQVEVRRLWSVLWTLSELSLQLCSALCSSGQKKPPSPSSPQEVSYQCYQEIPY